AGARKLLGLVRARELLRSSRHGCPRRGMLRNVRRLEARLSLDLFQSRPGPVPPAGLSIGSRRFRRRAWTATRPGRRLPEPRPVPAGIAATSRSRAGPDGSSRARWADPTLFPP